MEEFQKLYDEVIKYLRQTRYVSDEWDFGGPPDSSNPRFVVFTELSFSHNGDGKVRDRVRHLNACLGADKTKDDYWDSLDWLIAHGFISERLPDNSNDLFQELEGIGPYYQILEPYLSASIANHEESSPFLAQL